MRARRLMVALLAGLALAGGALWSVDGSVAARPTRASNRSLARTAAARILAAARLPVGAVPVARDPSATSWLRDSTAMLAPTREAVDDHSFWRVPGDPRRVIAWVKAHPPAGARLSTTGHVGQTGKPVEWFVAFSFPPHTGRVWQETLGVGVTAAVGGGTAMRADGAAVWIVPRPPGQVVPPAVREVEVRIDHYGRTAASPIAALTSQRKIRRLTRFVDSRLIEQPGVATACPMIGPETRLIELRFLGAGGAVLARTLEDGCGGLRVWIRGRMQRALQEQADLGRLLRRLGVGRA